MTAQYRIDSIETGSYNQRPVKFFTLLEWNPESSAWIHAGRFTAPAHMPNSALVQHALEKIDNTIESWHNSQPAEF